MALATRLADLKDGLPLTSTDEELVARSIGGDADSFNQLVLRWERPIYALAYRTIGREEDARDVCQETFLRAFRALPGFRGQAKFSSWLYRIALNLCRDWVRRERRTGFVQPPEDVDLMELAAADAPTESIEDLIARKDQVRAIERAMALLPEEQRTAIVLKEYHGLTFQEIADLSGCPLSTVKTRLYQGLAVLRRELARRNPWRVPNEARRVRKDPPCSRDRPGPGGPGRTKDVMTENICRYPGDREQAIVAYLYGDSGDADAALVGDFEEHSRPAGSAVRSSRRSRMCVCRSDGGQRPSLTAFVRTSTRGVRLQADQSGCSRIPPADQSG